MNHRATISGLMLAALTLAAPLRAQEVDPQIEGAKLCTRNLAHYERQYGIPMHLLSAISATESGRYHEGLKITLPWPWTINVEGQGHYYDTKEQAVAAVRQYKAQGARSIDVGCMQVSLLHHPDAFANLDEAFDPEHNVAYGAGFLRGLFEESHSWKQASADYHSKTPSRGQEYVSQVYSRWTNIIDRLRQAKAAIPAETETALAEKTPAAKTMNISVADATPAPKPKIINVRPTVSSNRMNSISITTVDKARDNGVLVIRPKISVVNDTPQIASVVEPVAVPVPAMVQQAPDEARVIHVADTRPAPVANTGPRFVFDN